MYRSVLALIGLTGLVGCWGAREAACVGLAEADCTGNCQPVTGSSCVDGADTYVGCVVRRNDDVVCLDLGWTCAAADNPDVCVFLPCYYESQVPGWENSCPLNTTPCAEAPDCPP